jgi:hypothetical protein
VDLEDPATMAEVKLSLYGVTGVQTRRDTSIWTPEDEAVLRLWDTNESVRGLGVMRAGPHGWMVPSGTGIRLMVGMMGDRAWQIPLIASAAAKAEGYWLGSVESSNPRIGNAPQRPQPPPPGVDPVQPPPEDPDADQPVQPSDPPRVDIPTTIIDSRKPPSPQTATTVSHRNVGIAVAAVGIVAALAYYMRR